MFKKMALRLMHFMKMESLAMKVNHPLATYGGIFVIVLNVEKKKPLRKIIQKEGRKNPLNKSSKKDMKQVIQKLISLENSLENLTIMFFILELEIKKSLLLFHVKKSSPKKIMIKTLSLH